jgi:hypothetical protein
VTRQPGALGPHPAFQCDNHGLDPFLSDGMPLIGRGAVDLALFSEDLVDATNRLDCLEEQTRMQKRSDETDEQAFSRFITSDPVGREMFTEYRESQLMSMRKACGCAPANMSAADAEDDDGMDPEAAMEACEKRVSELVARGASAAAAWDEVSLSSIFKSAKRLTVARSA